MFVLVLALNYNGDTMRIAGLLAEGHPVWTVGGSAFVAANVVNNAVKIFLLMFPPSAFKSAFLLPLLYHKRRKCQAFQHIFCIKRGEGEFLFVVFGNFMYFYKY